MNDPRFKLIKDFREQNIENELIHYDFGIKLDPWHLNHYFHFMEILIGIWAHSRSFKKVDVIISPVLLEENFKSLLQIILPLSQIIFTKNYLVKECLVVNRFEKNLNFEKVNLNKMLENSLKICTEHFSSLREKLFSYYKLKSKEKPKTIKDIQLTFIMRKGPRTINNVEELFEFLNTKYKVKPNCVWFENMSIKNQMSLMANTDILLGVHGNGLTNLLWLPEHAGIIEIFGNYHHYDYQIFSEISGIKYFGFLNDINEEITFKNGTRFRDATGFPNKPINKLKLKTFQKSLDEILERIF